MLSQFSDQIADAVAAVAPAVVQVHGGTRPASGLVFADGAVLTTMRALGREDRALIRRHDGATFDGEVIGWDAATRIAVLRVAGLGVSPVGPSRKEPRVGHIGIAVARSWSNAVTASAGLVSVIGGPLPTGRRRAIERVIRTSAPMHEGFAGGAFLNAEGAVTGVATAGSIRGLGVVIPAPIAWSAASQVLERAGQKRGYLGIAAHPVRVSQKQAGVAGREEAILVVAVKQDSPADAAGILVGDILLSFDGKALAGPEDLVDLLQGSRVGVPIDVSLIRGGVLTIARPVVAERA